MLQPEQGAVRFGEPQLHALLTARLELTLEGQGSFSGVSARFPWGEGLGAEHAPAHFRGVPTVGHGEA